MSSRTLNPEPNKLELEAQERRMYARSCRQPSSWRSSSGISQQSPLLCATRSNEYLVSTIFGLLVSLLFWSGCWGARQQNEQPAAGAASGNGIPDGGNGFLAFAEQWPGHPETEVLPEEY